MTDNTPSIDPKDEAEIRAVILDYVDANDSKDFARIANAFTDTGTLGNEFAKYIPGGELFNGVMPGSGGTSVAQNVGGLMGPLDATQHFIGAMWLEPTETGIRTRTQVIAHHHRAGGFYHSGGTYIDDFVRTANGWRIQTRVLYTIWTTGDIKVVTGD